jgi:ABC-type spermidine/putrescine transport system permease subunit I
MEQAEHLSGAGRKDRVHANWGSVLKGARKNSKHYLMLLPFFFFYSLFFLYPIYLGFNTSFYKWDGVNPAQYVGLNNYINLIRSSDFVKSFTNLLKYVSITVPVGITVAFLLALFVNSLKGFWSTLFRSAYFVPTMMPLFLAASIWRWMYAPEVGMINTAIGWLGFDSVNWLKDPKVMIFSLVIVDVWRAAGWNMVILLAGLKNIPEEYYDAARVDGANKWQEVLYHPPAARAGAFLCHRSGIYFCPPGFRCSLAINSIDHPGIWRASEGVALPYHGYVRPRLRRCEVWRGLSLRLPADGPDHRHHLRSIHPTSPRLKQMINHKYTKITKVHKGLVRTSSPKTFVNLCVT